MSERNATGTEADGISDPNHETKTGSTTENETIVSITGTNEVSVVVMCPAKSSDVSVTNVQPTRKIFCWVQQTRSGGGN